MLGLDGSAVKSTGYSSRGPEFNCQQLHDSSQPSILSYGALFWFAGIHAGRTVYIILNTLSKFCDLKQFGFVLYFTLRAHISRVLMYVAREHRNRLLRIGEGEISLFRDFMFSCSEVQNRLTVLMYKRI